jgi:hypothetical protein
VGKQADESERDGESLEPDGEIPCLVRTMKDINFVVLCATLKLSPRAESMRSNTAREQCRHHPANDMLSAIDRTSGYGNSMPRRPCCADCVSSATKCGQTKELTAEPDVATTPGKHEGCTHQQAQRRLHQAQRLGKASPTAASLCLGLQKGLPVSSWSLLSQWEVGKHASPGLTAIACSSRAQEWPPGFPEVQRG